MEKEDICMKKSKIVMLIILIMTIVLEILPYGAICNFANPDGNSVRKTYSYFDLTPFGYANYGPFITAILTCFLVVLCIICIMKNSKKLSKSISVISGISVITSLLPLMYGVAYVSVIGAIISVLLLSLFLISVLWKKPKNNKLK